MNGASSVRDASVCPGTGCVACMSDCTSCFSSRPNAIQSQPAASAAGTAITLTTIGPLGALQRLSGESDDLESERLALSDLSSFIKSATACFVSEMRVTVAAG